jgi:predicted small metal-binding protein
MPDTEYMLFCCREVVPTCGFEVKAKTEKEMMEHIQVHAESAHGLKEIKPGTMEKVKAAIKPVTVED